MGDGDPRVPYPAAEEMKLQQRGAANLGVGVVNGFTGSSIWHLLYSFPPVSDEVIQRDSLIFGPMEPDFGCFR
ncbi:MAG: hypothetical protein Ct9H300mP15_00750 [Gemmatimonadota bacterium]|nr:MAG: hypothetical protein Ct9H300mP15_00750 [Gemmatimonadota bacterium]